MQKLIAFFTPKVRRYLYSVGICVTTLLAAYGVINDDKLMLWNLLLAALLGMAVGNVKDSNTK